MRERTGVALDVRGMPNGAALQHKVVQVAPVNGSDSGSVHERDQLSGLFGRLAARQRREEGGAVEAAAAAE